ncbi:ribonuclease H-like domain-containing protein [Macrophomina phaseolina]|uniref:Ribonuclease H-like domain-containing protein n=1 Tax=Macrophomina phaseolina TaxID=35725 RepID=A0ABQ8GRC7_9PEZI|nr:ribonuclease H-like domain-containing protein [Macrophomina phaseolina]
MEVDKTAFWGRLLEILQAISEAHFVSFDLELSGIPTKERSGTKMTLEERYLDIKAAADRYQILQIGLTCVQEDLDTESYTVRPYNFNLNPLLEERLDIERIWSFQSGAAEFLLSHGFQMDLPMTTGVPYLSRAEAQKAKELAYARWDRSNIADVQLREDEVQSLEFVRKVRVVIDEWRNTGKPYLNIVCGDPTGDQPRIPELGNFEKRLVHQLVRAEYPELVSVPKPQYVSIVHYDEEREKSILRGKKRSLRGQIERQTGFRWIIEALCGGQLEIDAESFARDVHTGAVKSADMFDLKARFGRAQLALQRRRPALVGHNLFTDIIYLYRTFIGPLPPTLEEFRVLIHQHFPLVVDTKYMATHNCGDINPKSSLEEIHNKLRAQAKPLIVTHAAHSKYHVAEPLHEAGYDSFMTALIMIRLSTKLEEDGVYLQDVSPPLSEDEAYDTAPEDTSDGASPAAKPSSNQSILSGIWDGTTESITPSMAFNEDWNDDSTPLAQTAAPLDNTEPARRKKAERRKQKTSGKKSGSGPAAKGEAESMFSHKNMFAQLALGDLEGGEDEESEGNSEVQMGYPSRGPGEPRAAAFESDGTTLYSYTPSVPKIDKVPEVNRDGMEPMTLMPPFESDFWRVYGNKLRVFGTAESVWRLRSAMDGAGSKAFKESSRIARR